MAIRAPDGANNLTLTDGNIDPEIFVRVKLDKCIKRLTKPSFTKYKSHNKRKNTTMIKNKIITIGVIRIMVAQQLVLCSVLSFSPAKCTVAWCVKYGLNVHLYSNLSVFIFIIFIVYCYSYFWYKFLMSISTDV